MINAVDAQFSGSLGYAANWDNYNYSNVVSTIWEHSAIDFMGIDSYFTNLLTIEQAANSGTYPNTAFITQVEDAWTAKLENEILLWSGARKSGNGMPVVFTEVGYLPKDYTSRNPQNSAGTALDKDEQNMAFEGLMRALDGRKATGDFLAAHVWQWDMLGSGGSEWNMNPNGGSELNNQQTAQWLSSFVNGTNPDPFGGGPGGQGSQATQILYGFESGTEGFFYPNFETQPSSSLAQVSGTGATEQSHSLAITKPTTPWTWDARVALTGDQLEVLQNALLDNINDYTLEMDVTYISDDLPSDLSSLEMHLSMESNLDDWSQVESLAAISGVTNQTINIEVPLSSFDLTAGLSTASFTIGFVGQWSSSQDATIYIDRIALTDTTFVAPELGDFNGDGIVDAADYSLWRDNLGLTDESKINFAGVNDGVIDEEDYATWQANFGATASSSAANTVPEPNSLSLLLLCLCFKVAGIAPRAVRPGSTSRGKDTSIPHHGHLRREPQGGVRSQ